MSIVYILQESHVYYTNSPKRNVSLPQLSLKPIFIVFPSLFLVMANCPHTIGVEFGTRIIEVAGQKIKLQIWDTGKDDID